LLVLRRTGEWDGYGSYFDSRVFDVPNVRRLPDPLATMRMTLDGKISIGRDILSGVTSETPAGTPNVAETGALIRRLQSEQKKVRARAKS
jgi:hypothetical protein